MLGLHRIQCHRVCLHAALSEIVMSSAYLIIVSEHSRELMKNENGAACSALEALQHSIGVH